MFTYFNQIIDFTILVLSKYSFYMQDLIVEKIKTSWVVL